jgi:hypothetical protein
MLTKSQEALIQQLIAVSDLTKLKKLSIECFIPTPSGLNVGMIKSLRSRQLLSNLLTINVQGVIHIIQRKTIFQPLNCYYSHYLYRPQFCAIVNPAQLIDPGQNVADLYSMTAEEIVQVGMTRTFKSMYNNRFILTDLQRADQDVKDNFPTSWKNVQNSQVWDSSHDSLAYTVGTNNTNDNTEIVSCSGFEGENPSTRERFVLIAYVNTECQIV